MREKSSAPTSSSIWESVINKGHGIRHVTDRVVEQPAVEKMESWEIGLNQNAREFAGAQKR